MRSPESMIPTDTAEQVIESGRELLRLVAMVVDSAPPGLARAAISHRQDLDELAGYLED